MIKVYVNLAPTLNSLKQLEGKISNSSILLDEVGDYIEGRILENFRKEIDPYNSRWTPLSPATISDKQRRRYPRNTLVRTGAMKRSLRLVNNGKSIKVSIGFPAQFHQRGTKKIPQRQILPENRLSRSDQRNITDIALSYVEV